MFIIYKICFRIKEDKETKTKNMLETIYLFKPALCELQFCPYLSHQAPWFSFFCQCTRDTRLQQKVENKRIGQWCKKNKDCHPKTLYTFVCLLRPIYLQLFGNFTLYPNNYTFTLTNHLNFQFYPFQHLTSPYKNNFQILVIRLNPAKILENFSWCFSLFLL